MGRFLLSSCLIVLCVVVGCRPQDSSMPSDSVDQQADGDKLAEARGQYEIANIHAQAHFSQAYKEMEEKRQARLDESLREAEKQADSASRDFSYARIVERLAFENRFVEATKIVPKIEESATKNRLLEDIARLQMKEVLQLLKGIPVLASKSSENKIPGDILQLIQAAISTAEQISDPLQRAESFANIALMRINMKDHDGAFEVLQKAAASLQELSDDDMRKARGLCRLARWYLRIDQTNDARTLCREASQVAEKGKTPEEKSAVYLELASAMLLSGDENGARHACDEAVASAKQIDSLQIKATALLQSANVILLLPLGKNEGSTAESLQKIRQIVLASGNEISKQEPSNPISAALSERTVASASTDSFDAFARPVSISPLSREEIENQRDVLLQKIAKMQVWGSPLEDVWETVQDIKGESGRDAALVEAIEMLVATRKFEDAEAWIDELSDPDQKSRMKQLSKQKQKESP